MRTSAKLVSPLAAAIRRRHAPVASVLVQEGGAPLDPVAIHLCVANRDLELLRKLLELRSEAVCGNDSNHASGDGGVEGVDIRFSDTGVTALMLASEAGDLDAVQTLLEMGADAAAVDADGHTCLMRAAVFGHAKLVGALMSASCEVDAVDAEGNSALHHAGRGGQEYVFDLLEMRYGADPELRNHKGEVPKVSSEACRVQ